MITNNTILINILYSDNLFQLFEFIVNLSYLSMSTFGLVIITISSIILLSSSGGIKKALEIGHKVITGASATYALSKAISGDSGGNSDNSDDDNKKDKKTDNNPTADQKKPTNNSSS